MSNWQENFNNADDVIKSEKLSVATTESELRELYFEQAMTVKEVGSELGCSRTTALRFMKEAGIERRNCDEYYKDKKYRDKDWLRKKYLKERKNFVEIAEEADASKDTIANWLDKFELREKRVDICNFSFTIGGSKSMKGYPRWTATGAKSPELVYVHHLVMISEGADPDKVFGDSGYQIHHRNGFKCDNRPSNLELVDRRTHGRHHTPDNKKWTDDDILAAMRLMMDPSELLDE